MNINAKSLSYGTAKSSIRELAAYGAKRRQEVGPEHVFDFSIGNPSVPAPAAVATSLAKNIQLPPHVLHSYTPAAGLFEVRERIAANLNARFSTSYSADDLYLTCGAAASVSIALHAVVEKDDEVIVIAPFFPEYAVWVDACHAKLVVALADPTTFDLDLSELESKITPRTKAIIIDSPNNPTGVIYSASTLARLGELVRKASRTYGHDIYVISDEPYRYISYGCEVPWVPDYIDHTLVCYSYSKSLSLPGERIGWVLVASATQAPELMHAVAGAGRSLGFVCAPALFQRVIADCVDVPAPVAAYQKNRDALMNILDAYGFSYATPQGAFYLWMQALEADAENFSRTAKRFDLLLVPSDSFGTKGWVRLGYCVSYESILASKEAFAQLKGAYETK